MLRSVKFCRYLPEFGWQPVVLTVHPRAHEQADIAHLQKNPDQVPVIRAFALDTQRHLGIRGRYWRFLAIPDRWVSWFPAAVWAGLSAIREYRIDLILTTFPIATAVLIGLALHRITGKPWVVDFRDSMTEEEYPRDPRVHQVWRWIERQAVRRASALVFTAASTMRMYLQRYPRLTPEKCWLISNGYDEEDFGGLQEAPPKPPSGNRPLRLLHTGLIYPEERDPRPFFRALARHKREGQISAANLQIELRAPGFETEYSRMIRELEIADVVHLLPRVSYRQSLEECAAADGVLLFQAGSCDHQIPAKAYEYLRLRKPILALATQNGDTAALLREVGGATIIDLADEEAIYLGLPGFLRAVCLGNHPLPDGQKIRRYARRHQAEELAKYLSALKETARPLAVRKAESVAR